MSTPDVTVALLTRNAGPLLARLLAAVASQETSRRVECLAIDSGSTDGSLETLARSGARVVRIAPEEFEFGRTRDLAFGKAKAPLVVSLSQDAVPAHPRWLDCLLAPLADPQVAASCGRSVFDPERTHRQFAWERNGWFYFTRDVQHFKRANGPGLSNANSAIRRAVWEELRFGPQTIGEDFALQKKLLARGLRIAFPEGAEVLHHHDYDLRALWKRCRNEGVGFRELGCPYSLASLLVDLLGPRKYRLWLKELARGSLRSPAELLFPLVRPAAGWWGHRFGRGLAR